MKKGGEHEYVDQHVFPSKSDFSHPEDHHDQHYESNPQIYKLLAFLAEEISGISARSDSELKRLREGIEVLERRVKVLEKRKQ